MQFLDEAKIDVRGGRGGNGCVAFRREKFVPRGGPSGGDGGHGGDVWLRADIGLNTLYHLHFQPLWAADRGRHGEGSNKTGKSGGDVEVTVPPGTVVFDADSGELLGEVLVDGERLLVARGGRGGRGNARFVSATNRAPRRADPGEEGEQRRLRLELRLLADVGVVGLPNAGKSTLISVISAARPKIADYPFTTLVPQLGVVATDLESDPFVIADLPGLIAGAAQGAGLGHQFLRHVERCRVLLHLVDLSDFGDDAAADLAVVEQELAAFDPGLLRRPRVIVGSKLDAARPERQEQLRAVARRAGGAYLEISSATNQGISELVRCLQQLLAAHPAPQRTAPAPPRVERERFAAADPDVESAAERDGGAEEATD
jgi:GTP-binding protein